jgi:hypothetical protein
VIDAVSEIADAVGASSSIRSRSRDSTRCQTRAAGLPVRVVEEESRDRGELSR